MGPRGPQELIAFHGKFSNSVDAIGYVKCYDVRDQAPFSTILRVYDLNIDVLENTFDEMEQDKIRKFKRSYKGEMLLDGNTTLNEVIANRL